VSDDRTPDSDAAEAERRRRQAPQYGEYATPEEVAELRGPDAPPIVPVRPASPPPPAGRPLPGPPPEGHRRPAGWDAIATIGLLAFGAWNVLSGIAGFSDLPTFLRQAAEQGGVTGFHAPAGLQTLGWVLIGIWAVLLLIAIVWSMRRLRTGRVAFWVPLVIGAPALLGTAVLFAIVLYASGATPVLQNQG
jgi:hypothetical protein